MLSMVGHWIYNWILGWGGLGAVVSIAAWAAWFFTPAFLLPIKSLLLHIAVGATIFTFTSSYFYTKGYNTGYAVAIHAVAAQDQRAVKESEVAKGTVSDCFNSGGTWNVEDASCAKP